MLDKSSLIPAVLARLKKMPIGHALDLRTYKRDRSVLIVKQANDAFRVVENGFAGEEFAVAAAGLARLLKTLLKREFPRSNKIRLYQLGEYDK